MLHTHFINGEWVAGQGHDLVSIDPAKNEVIWEGKSATASQIDDARNRFRLETKKNITTTQQIPDQIEIKA